MVLAIRKSAASTELPVTNFGFLITIAVKRLRAERAAQQPRGKTTMNHETREKISFADPGITACVSGESEDAEPACIKAVVQAYPEL